MPAQRRDRGINRGIDSRSSVRTDHGHRPGSQALQQGDHVVERHQSLAIARDEMLDQRAEGLGIRAGDGRGQAVGQGSGVGQELAQGEVRVPGSERRVGCDRTLERPGGETSGGAANGRRIGWMAGGEVALREAEGWVAHGQEVYRAQRACVRAP